MSDNKNEVSSTDTSGTHTMLVKQFKAMGSPCAIRLIVEDKPSVKASAEATLKRVVEDIDGLEERYSRFKDDNLLYKVNQIARQGGEITVDEEFSSLLDYADACYQQSDGLFDITSGPLQAIWSLKAREADQFKLPTREKIDETLVKIGWQDVARDGCDIRFCKPGMSLDFGGIVKEYAADRAAGILRTQGFNSGCVDLGGDIHVLGPHPDGSPWKIHIRDSASEDRRQAFAHFDLSSGGVASSGSYERFIELEGQRYCHIISPKTGWPIQTMAAVTVVAAQCVIAGSISTIAMLKEGAAADWLESVGLPYFWRTVDGRFGASGLGTIN